MAERPGIMVYFDKWEPMLKLSNEEVGGLFRAALLYGRYGALPELSGMHEVLWGLIQPDIDRDDVRFQRGVWQKKYAVYCREQKKKGEPAMTREEWDEQFYYQAVSHDIKQYPLSTSTSLSTAYPAATPAPPHPQQQKAEPETKTTGILTIPEERKAGEAQDEEKRRKAIDLLEKSNYGAG